MRTGAFLLLFLFATNAFAAFSDPSCTEFRLDQPGGTMEHIPVRDQHDLGICFSYAASDMIDAYRFSHKPPAGDKNYSRLTSPLAAAIEAGKRMDRPVQVNPGGSITFPFENGNACPVINNLRSHGSCDRNSLSDAWPSEDATSSFHIWRAFENYRHGDAAAAPACLAQYPHAADILKTAIKQDAPLAYFKYVVGKACGANARIPDRAPLCVDDRIDTPQGFNEIFSRHFDKLLKKAQPMEITYCYGLLESGSSYSGVVKNNGIHPAVKYNLCKGYDPKDPEGDGAHSSTVIGRRLHNNKCQILIKNSWGSSCDGYAPEWSCEKGKIWVDQDTLSNNVTEYSVIGNK